MSRSKCMDFGGLTLIVDGIRTGATTPGATGSLLTSTEIEYLDGLTTGAVTASKAMVVDSSRNINNLNDLDMTGDLTVDGVVGTGAATPGVITLTTPELTVVALDQLGRIDFQAPLETGADAILVAASIWAEADSTFGAALNSTDFVFALGTSEVAAEKMRLHHEGDLTVQGSVQSVGTTSVVANTSSVGVLSFAGGMQLVTNTNDADDYIDLPTNVAADVGKSIKVFFVAGCEVRSADASAKLNNVTVGATNEAPFVAGDLAVFTCVSDNNWTVHAEDIVGATKTIVANSV